MSSPQYYCGIDLHKNRSTLCVIDAKSREVVMLVTIKHSEAWKFVDCLDKYKEDGLVIAIESTFNWYWLIDFLESNGFNVVLGDAEFVGSICRRKHKSDALDAENLAKLLMTGLFPKSHICHQDFRGIRDLNRGISSLQQVKSDLERQSKTIEQQYFFSAADFSYENQVDQHAKALYESRKSLIALHEVEIKQLTSYMQSGLQKVREKELSVLRTFPGIGGKLSAEIILETEYIERFQSVRNFSSYCGFASPNRISAGKSYGQKGQNKCNHRLKKTFHKAAISFIRYSVEGRSLYEKIKQTHKVKTALNIVAHKITRAVYYMLKNNTPFDVVRFS